MCIRPKWLKNIIVPSLFLSGRIVNVTFKHKYLGMHLQDSMKDDVDMKRQMRGIYARGNVLLKRFRNCDDNVKIKLFRLYCSSFYCMNLWSRFTSYSYRKVKSAYNRIFRNLLNINKEEMSNVMVLNGVKSFKEIERDLVFSFRSRLFNSENTITTVLIDSLVYHASSLTKYWNKILYL